MPAAKARILCGNTTLFPWKIISIEEKLTIQGLFEYIVDQYIPRLKEEVLEKIEARCSKVKEQAGDEIELGCIISDVVSNFGNLFTFNIKKISNENNSQLVNAFDILRNVAKELHLPTFSFSKNPKLNDKLKLDILSYISSHKGGWTFDVIPIEKKFIKELSDALWYVDKCGYKTFNDRYTIPVKFFQFVGRFDPVREKKRYLLFTYDELNFHSQNMTAYLEMSWINHPCFDFLKPPLVKFASDLQKYAEYLLKKTVQTKKNHDSMIPIVNEGDAGKLKIILPVMFRNPAIITKYKELINAVEFADYWKTINVDPYCPDNRTAKSTYLQKLEETFTFKMGMYTYHHGNIMNTTFIWKIDPSVDESIAFEKNYKIRSELKNSMPVYATRAMRREFVDTCDMFLGNVEKSRVRRIYKEFVGDSTADEMEIDIRVKLAFDLRDPDIITDLRHFNEGRISIYDTFWEYSKKFLEGTAQDSVVAVDERRHDPIVHLARAISVKDLKNQIAKLCPKDTPIPSVQWLKLQFWPKNPWNLSSLQFTGILPLKFMIQIRQLHMDHIDSHYASAIFRYLKELAIKFKDNTWLVFLDDKHRCKIGEPGHPVAAIERGKQVVVTTHETFAVSDHDFTKCSLISSVMMICNIPDNIEGSFYQGHVNIGLKDATFQISSSLRHMTEFLEDIREKAKINNQLEEELLQSMEPTRDLLSSIFTRQNLKDEPFKMFKPATKTEMETFWESVHLVDDSITMDDTSQKKVADKPKLQEFMEHCCRKRLYFFEIKKCGSGECDIWEAELKGLPDPIPGPDDHYISFLEAYEKETTEEYCPSLRNRKPRNKSKDVEKKGENGMDFSPTAQYGKNVRTIVKCVECNKPRVLYARHKISEEEFRLLQSFLESIEYTCGVTFKGLSELSSSKSRKESDIDVNDDDEKENNNGDMDVNEDSEKENNNGDDPIAELFKIVQINKKHTCTSAIEKPYFVARIFPQICNICGISEDLIQVENELPYCKECHVSAGEKRKIGKRKYFDGGNKNSRKKRKIGN
ncbi:unnamed protein product [Rhizophagus irregularis]|nr:unnamed protein product [Rhizophagus irregularis]